jgi:putative endonuclease
MDASNIKTASSPPVSMSQHLELGRRGEELAAAYLQQAGFRIVASNFSVPVGRNRVGAVINVEIDLVAYEESTLCFVEVKTRASDWFADPSVNVDVRKQRQITRAARVYRRIFGLTGVDYRYDVLSIVLPSSGVEGSAPQIDLARSFWTEEKFRKRRWPERYWD